MGRLGFLRRLWLTRFSQPAVDRGLLGHVLRRKPGRVIQVGLGSLDRAARLLSVAAAVNDGGAVHFVGLDRFEGRQPTEPPGPTLKQAHRRLHALGRVQLVPGNADTALARLCNHLGVFDLVVIGAETDERHLERCWFFIQRITNAGSLVLLEKASAGGRGGSWQVVPKAAIDALAARSVLRRAG
jgi:hypothetical protein